MLINFLDHNNHHYRLADETEETDSPYQPKPELDPVFEEISVLLRKKDKHAEKKLQQWINENPDVPQLKNYLTVYYSLRQRNDLAFAYNHQVAREHPQYLFAKINLALEYITRKELEKVPEILGPTLSLKALYPERNIFHVTEYTNYYKLVFRYWHSLHQLDKLRPIFFDLQKLEKKFDDDFGLDELNRLLMINAVERLQETILHAKELAGITRTEPTLPQTAAQPAFHFPQIQWLYENSFSIEKRKVDELLGLERSRLTEDLSAVVYDAIRRYDYFSEKDYDPVTHDFPVHALLLLQELEASEGLPAILEFLRQPDEILDYWLSDLVTEYLWQVVYATGKNQLDRLEDFLKEPLNYTYARSAVSTAVSQLALHQPERKEEIIALYRRLLRFFSENKDNPEVRDGSLLAFIIGDITDFNGRELADDMKRLFDEGLVDESIEGQWPDVQQRLKTDEAERERSSKRPVQNIDELIEELHGFEQRIEQRASKGSVYEEKDEGFSDYEEVNTNGGTLVYSGHQPFQRAGEKIGRNDPCPCGSGLKYKKCHGKNG